MSIRSVVFGFIGAAFICGFTYFNDYVLDQTFLVGNHFPLSVYGTLLLFLLFNFGLFKLNKRLAFTGKEFSVVIGMTLVACCIPSSGLMRVLPTSMMMPHYHNKTRSGWQRSRIIDEVTPRGMLVDVWKEVATGTLTSAEDHTITLDELSAETTSFDQMQIRITSGEGKNQVRRIVSYNAETKTAEIDAAWMFMPKAGDRIVLAENNEAEVLTPYLEGQQNTGDDKTAGGIFHNSIIPWHAWKRPLSFWVPMILGLWIAVIGLSMVVHRQWAVHEHLPYPISSIISSLLPGEGAGISEVIKARKFQVAFGVVFAIYLSNYISSWFPEYWPEISRQIDFSPIVQQLKLQSARHLQRPTIYFTVIAIAYFLASDVSFSLGLSGIISSVIFGTFLASYGINWQNGDGSLIRYKHFLVFGAYLGSACIILYTGRFYYLNVLKKTFGLKSQDDLPSSSIWGGRSLLFGFIVFVFMLISIGISAPIALLYTTLLLMMFLVMGRIIAETGLFFIQTGWVLPSAIIIGLFGARSMGPEMISALLLIGMIFCIDPRECLMPFVMNSLRLFDLQKVTMNRGVSTLAAALVLGLAVAIPATLFYQYKYGVSSMNRWATHNVATFSFEDSIKLRSSLEARDVLEESMNYSTLERFTKIKPLQSGYLGWLAAGFALSLGFSICRLKFTKWPLHPIMFLIILSYSMRCFWFSFFIGWIIKVMVTRFGGSKVYRSMKPLIIGLVAGELMGALVPVIYGLIYYFSTGEVPKSFRAFPG